MKPDGATMETSEPDQAAAAHRPPQEAATEEGQPAAAAAQKANGKPVAVDPKARLKAGGSKVQPSSTGVAGSGSRPGTASHRAEKDAKPSAGRKAAGSASAAGAAPNRAAGAKNQSRVLDRRPVGPVKTSSLPDAAASNGTKPRGPNGAAKRAPAQAANGAKPKTTAPKSNNSNSTKPAAPAASKTTTTSTRPAAGSLTSRPASAVPKPAAAAKPSITATAKVSRAAAPPPAGRTAAVQPSKNAPAAKKDVSRPPPAARKPVAAAAAELPAARKPVAAAGLPASKKIEASRSANAAKPNSAPKAATATKAAAPKVQPPAKPAPTKKPPAAARLPLASRAPGRTPPASPAGRPAGASKPATPATKRGARPPQTGSPFTKKTSDPPVPEAPPQRTAAPAAEPAAPTEKPESAAVEEVQTRGDGEPEEVAQREEAAPPHPLTPPPQQEQTTVAPSGAPPKEPGSPDQTPAPPAASFAPKAAPLNLNEEEEEEEEEEREGSQLVSVSEMSGTTQPTEESRPGSGGAVGGAAWKAGGVWLSELDSEEVSGSQQGASELSAPGVLEGTESTDELGDGSLKGAMDMEGASAGSPDFEKVPDIPANEDDDSDRVCDMEVGSERTDEPRGLRHDNDVDEEDDEDVEMASEGVTESGLESYGNADEDDFADDERLDNLNRVVQPPPPPLPSAPAAQWDQQNPSDCRWAGPSQSCLPQGPEGEPEAQAWPGGGASASAPEGQDVPHPPQTADPRGPAAAPGPSPSSEASTPEERHQERKLSSPAFEAPPHSSQEVQTDREEEEEEEAEPETLPADEVLGGPSTAPTSNPSSSSVTEDEASDTEGEAQLEASSAICNLTFDPIPPPQRCLSTVEEEAERAPGDEAASPASFIFDSNTTPSTKSPGIFSLEELPLEAIKEPYMEAGRQEAEPAKEAGPERRGSKEPLEETTDVQPQYYAICEKTDDSFPGSSSMPQRRDHSSYPRTFCDIIKPAAAPPRLSCADLPPRSAGQQALSPQLRRLEQHHRQLQELQQRREQQSRPLEEAEQERKRRAEEEERKKKEEAEEEIKRNKEERKEEEELKQMMQWQQEARQEARQEAQPSSKAQAALPSPSSVLCTIYEALESSEEEAEDGEPLEKESPGPEPPPLPDFPERPPPLDLDWGEKVDMVQQLINQTLLLHGDGCSSLLLLPGGSGGTLSPLESSLWPRLLPPLTPPSATVTSVSSFSPEAAGSSSQGEWTVVELETHH